MARYNKQLVDRILELTEDGAYSISQICDTVNISRKTFYKWKQSHPGFAAELIAAENRRFESLKDDARLVLHRKLEGYITEIKRTVYIPDKDDPTQLVLKQQVITEKFCEPDTRFLLQLLAIDKSSVDKQKEELNSIEVGVRVEQTKEDLSSLNEAIMSVLKSN